EHHGIDRVRLGIFYFRFSVVVKQKSARIGLVRPAKTALDVGIVRPREINLRRISLAPSVPLPACNYCKLRLVPPARAAHSSGMQLVIGFIDHVPRKDLAAVVADYG